MPKHIAQIAPRAASLSLLRSVLLEVLTIDAAAATSIVKRNLEQELETVMDPRWSGVASNEAFSAAFHEGMAIIVAATAQREGLLPMTKPEHDLLCHCVITCRSLREVMSRMATFMHALASRPARITLEIEEGLATFSISTNYIQRDRLSMLTDLCGLAAAYRLFSWLVDLPLPLTAVGMSYAPLIDSSAVAFMIPYSITYHAESNTLCFPAGILDRPVIRTPQELNLLLGRFPFDVDDTRATSETIASRVRSFMVAALSEATPPLTEQQMAVRLGISLSTLKRRLGSERTSYRKIRDDLLRDIAIDALKDNRNSVSLLARRLGYSDGRTFRQAFKRWTGYCPSREEEPGGAG